MTIADMASALRLAAALLWAIVAAAALIPTLYGLAANLDLVADLALISTGALFTGLPAVMTALLIRASRVRPVLVVSTLAAAATGSIPLLLPRGYLDSLAPIFCFPIAGLSLVSFVADRESHRRAIGPS
jgi:hypothetical protein